MTLALAGVLSLLVGVVVGLLGGGGAVLLVPLLVYGLHVPPKDAMATSLLVAGVAAGVGALAHARQGRVRLRTGLIFGLAGAAGAFGGGRVASLPGVPARLLLVLFALFTASAGVAMLRGPRADLPPARDVSALRCIALGATVGFVAGLVGASGGFLTVPALLLVGGLEMEQAVGTSLLVLTMQGLAGFAGHLEGATVDAKVTTVVLAGTVAGTLAGSRLAPRVPARTLRKGFGVLVLAIAVFVMAKQA